ncbi:hypothetical protein HRF68_24260, partial [Pseudomonas stutzeri]|nr:hypothetical protein [Stutzerimonas stutzeri]
MSSSVQSIAMSGLRRLAAAGMTALAISAPPAGAQEARDVFKTEIFLSPYSELGDATDQYPRFNGRILALTGNTNYFGIRDDNGQIPRSHWTSTQPQVESAFVLQLTNRFSIRAKATLDSATEETKDNAFSDLGAQLNNLFAAYTADHYALYGGKMDLGYGDAWHVIDGLYSGFTEGSEYRGAIGVGGRYTLDTAAAGSHSFAAVLFKRDDGSLSQRLSFDDGLLKADAP